MTVDVAPAIEPFRSAASVLLDEDGTIAPTVPEGSTLRLVAREEAADGVVKLTFADHRGRRLAPWTPGSHIDVILPDGKVRQYSLCGDRYDAFHYEIAVLREPAGRGGSAWIHDHAAPGDTFDFGGPRNLFPLVPAPAYSFIAGGIGITPILPMIRHAEQSGASWRLLYGGRSRSSMAFAAELVARYGDRVDLLPEDTHGRPDLVAWLGEPNADTRVYVCGPGGLIDAVTRVCEAWPPYTKHSERFVSAVDGGTQNRRFEAELRRTGRVVEVDARQTLLDALGEAGVTLLSSCRQGTCGTCEVRVLAGIPDHRDSVLSDDDRKAADCMMPCVSRAVGERISLDI